jgi:murein DD-endopeptidase MepM/ murein hydrolase activator NlpD
MSSKALPAIGVLRRRLIWRMVGIRRAARATHNATAGSLIGIPSALALLLALSPAGPLQLGNLPLGPAPFRLAHAEAAPPLLYRSAEVTPTPSAAVTASATVVGAQVGRTVNQSPTAPSPTPTSASILTSVTRSMFTSVTRSTTSQTPATAMPTQTATASPTPSPTATPTATASPTPSPTATSTATPNPYVNDRLTDITRVPGWQTINWAAYIPYPVATAVPGVTGAGQFIMPTTGFISTQYSSSHLAIDIAGPEGSAVMAADTGTVVFAGLDYGGFGYAVEIDHGNGYVSAYGHNSVIKVAVGQIVRRGDLIAYRGSTGHSTGPHVHFAIHQNGRAIDPFDVIIAGDPPAPAPQVLVPNLAGKTPSSALAALRGLTLRLTFDPAQPSSAVPAGELVTQQPAAGSLADLDATVHVALSSGPATPTPTATATPPVAVKPTENVSAVPSTATPLADEAITTTSTTAHNTPAMTPAPHAVASATPTNSQVLKR